MNACLICSTSSDFLHNFLVEDQNIHRDPRRLTICEECLKTEGMMCQLHEVRHLRIRADLGSNSQIPDFFCACSACCLEGVKRLPPEQLQVMVGMIKDFLTFETITHLIKGHEDYGISADIMAVYKILMSRKLSGMNTYNEVIAALVQQETKGNTVH